jgi:hypothetical protein
MKKCILLFCILSLASVGFSQNSSKRKNAIADENFKMDSLPHVLLKELNRWRIDKGLDTFATLEILDYAAGLSVDKMASSEKDKVELKTTQKHLKKAGATKRGEEITMKAPISKGRDNYKTDEVAKVIYNRWENNPKNLAVLSNPKYTLIGINCGLSDDLKKVYVSAVMGGYDITNEGLAHKSELSVPFNTKSKKLKGPEAKYCKTCDRWKNYDVLQKGLYEKNGKIYLKYSNAKELRRVLKKAKDGLAVDVVQREQFDKDGYNIVNNDLYNKGVMNKVVYKDKFFKKNLLLKDVEPKKRRKIKAIEVEMGKMPQGINGSYELNLIVVQDGHVCKTITRGYVENGNVESNTPIGLQAAKGTLGIKPPFEPRSESSIINFTIPFEKNKAEFKQEDIEPFIKALNEPDFVIEGLYIYAYSSIEGDSIANGKLQRKRAESVVNVLQGRQALKIKPTIETRDSWGLFMLENEDGKYADLVSMGKQKAISKINNDKALQTELEPILAKERFAQIIMDITYDVSGNKEQKFSTVSFNRALKSGNVNQAHKILEYISKKILEGKYSADAMDSCRVEENTSTVAFINNKRYFNYLLTNSVEDEDDETFTRLLKIEPSNPILQYNSMFCKINLDSTVGNTDRQAEMQRNIDALYGKLDSNLVNGLNIEWQFKLMEALDTLENADAQIEACVNRIKGFYKIKDASWQNALKLAYVFGRAKDFRYASTILEPYIGKSEVSSNLVFMYISLASHVQEKYYSRSFARALAIAKEREPDRYCKLFGEPYMTFQVLENVDVKKAYNGSCKK